MDLYKGGTSLKPARLDHLWSYASPLAWTLVFLAWFSFAGHIWSGRLPGPVMRAVPALGAMAPDCGSLQSHPETPANGYRTLGAAESERPIVGLLFVHGYHSDSNTWATLAGEIDLRLKQSGQSALAYFACYPSQDNTAFEEGAAAIARAQLLQKLPEGVPVLFVGHSFGGLVTKYYFLTHPEALDPDRMAVVTINSPHQGTPVYLLGYVTGESLLLDFKPTSDADPFGLAGNPLLERLNTDPLLQYLNYYTVTGTFVPSPVTAFLGGAFIAQSDGLVQAQSAHLTVGKPPGSKPDGYLGGVPYSCSVNTWETGKQEWRFTFSRPLHQGDIFHVNIPDNPTVSQILMTLLWDPSRPSGFGACGLNSVQPQNLAAQRLWAYLLAAVPALLLTAAFFWARRRLPDLGATLLAAAYGLAISFCAYIFSYLAPLGLYLVFDQFRDGVWMALVQAFMEEGWLMLWFGQYLLVLRSRDQFAPRHAYTAALLIGLVIAMVEQLLFVYTSGAAQPGIAWMRLVLATLPRLGLSWVVAWVALQRLDGGLPPWVRRLLLLLPPALHALYSALFFHVTDMGNAVVLYLLLLVPFATIGIVAWQYTQRAERLTT